MMQHVKPPTQTPGNMFGQQKCYTHKKFKKEFCTVGTKLIVEK
jgi:hypothetical protein